MRIVLWCRALFGVFRVPLHPISLTNRESSPLSGNTIEMHLPLKYDQVSVKILNSTLKCHWVFERMQSVWHAWAFVCVNVSDRHANRLQYENFRKNVFPTGWPSPDFTVNRMLMCSFGHGFAAKQQVTIRCLSSLHFYTLTIFAGKAYHI